MPPNSITSFARNWEFKAVFTWSEDFSEFEYTAIGFDDAEIDTLIEAKAHQGVDVNGYAVDLQ
jgi:hypothetical protein